MESDLLDVNIGVQHWLSLNIYLGLAAFKNIAAANTSLDCFEGRTVEPQSLIY